MKIIDCPLNGPRSVQEFICGGEVFREPLPNASASEWAAYVFMDENSSGIVDEWWCHVATAYWFIVRRNRTTNEIVGTFSVDQYFVDSDEQVVE